MDTHESVLEREAARFERIAKELQQAAAHCLTTAAHYRSAAIPRAAAHAWAASGHLDVATRELADGAVVHAAHSSPGTD